MSNIAFVLTRRELDALLVLEANPAAWPTFTPQTWVGLGRKRLVTLKPAPVLTPAGRAAIALMRSIGVNAPVSLGQPAARNAGNPSTTQPPA